MPIKLSKAQSRSQNADGIRRMQFFEDFLCLAKISLEEAARAISMTRPSLYHWLQPDVDDAKLSNVQDIIEYYGYDFNIFLTRENEEAKGPARVDITNFINLPGEDVRPNRLGFLTLALTRYKIGKVALAKKCNIAYTTVRYYFAQDDINIKKIFEIADACDFSIRIQIKKRGENDHGNKADRITGKAKRYYTVQLEQETVAEF